MFTPLKCRILIAKSEYDRNTFGGSSKIPSRHCNGEDNNLILLHNYNRQEDMAPRLNLTESPGGHC